MHKIKIYYCKINFLYKFFLVLSTRIIRLKNGTTCFYGRFSYFYFADKRGHESVMKKVQQIMLLKEI